MHSAYDTAIAKGAIGGAAIAAAMVQPDEYVSYFDRIYDIAGLFLISGGDAVRFVGLLLSLCLVLNVIYGWVKDLRGKDDDD